MVSVACAVWEIVLALHNNDSHGQLMMAISSSPSLSDTVIVCFRVLSRLFHAFVDAQQVEELSQCCSTIPVVKLIG